MTRLYNPTGKPFDLSRGNPQEIREEFELVAAGIDAVNLNGGYKNKIIGGNFDTNPWQRGVAFTNPADAQYCPDRFRCSSSGTAAFNWANALGAPTADQAGIYSSTCLEMTVTTADATIGATEGYGVSHLIEGSNIRSLGFGVAGVRYITLSFWHAHTVTGTYCCSFRNAASNRTYIAEYAQVVSNAWEKAEITIPVCETGTWEMDNVFAGLIVRWDFGSGSSYQLAKDTWHSANGHCSASQVNGYGIIGNKLRLTLVQLEAGTVATPFEDRPLAVELDLCKRYYERAEHARKEPFPYNAGYTSAIAFNISTVTRDIDLIVPMAEKRWTPGIRVQGSNNGAAYASVGGSVINSGIFSTIASVIATGYGRIADWDADAEF